MGLRILFLSGPGQGRTYPLPVGKSITVGRGEDNDICIPDTTSSRIHCQIENTGGRCRITDLSSANGTIVNGEKIDERIIQVGDQVVIGSTKCRLIADAATGATTVSSASAGQRAALKCVKCDRRILQSDVQSGRAKVISLGHVCPKCAPDFTEPEGTDRRSPTLFPPTFEGSESADSAAQLGSFGPYRPIAARPGTCIGPRYAARHSETRREVLIQAVGEKLAEDAGAAGAFLEKVKSLKELVHPNLHLIIDVMDSGERDCVVMEDMQGIALSDAMESRGPLDCEAILPVAAQVASALDYIHQKGGAHGDLLPEFVTIGNSGLVKVAGLGLEGPVAGDGPVARFKSSRGIAYLAYAAPELLSAEARPDARSDIYALGATLYAAHSGTLPFSADSVDEMLENVRRGVPAPLGEPPDEASAILRLIIDKCLSKEPDARYQEISELILDLQDAFREAGIG
ncbi:MAG TPA: FHA domain-containing serine/threonine-protein kinase [Candidatus Brocadiia bacterium]|nr:FHA domain-containing serine/threonine-protein kinase [Candidatus Brocadiia bacterium]